MSWPKGELAAPFVAPVYVRYHPTGSVSTTQSLGRVVGVTVPQDGGADVATRKVLLENVDTGAEEWTSASDLLQAALGNDGHALAALAVQLDADGWRVRGCTCCSRLILQSGIRAAPRRSDAVFRFLYRLTSPLASHP